MRIPRLFILAATAAVVLVLSPSASSLAADKAGGGGRPGSGSTTVEIAGIKLIVHVDVVLNLQPPIDPDHQRLTAQITIRSGEPNGRLPFAVATSLRVVAGRATWTQTPTLIPAPDNALRSDRQFAAHGEASGFDEGDTARATVDLVYGRRTIRVTVPVQISAAQ